MRIIFRQRGSFDKLQLFLKRLKQANERVQSILIKYGERGVVELSTNTPIDSGETANSWRYQIVTTRGGYKLVWTNTHVVDGVPIAVILQYGHATRGGSYVEGRDYINPVMQPIFDSLAAELWKEVMTT